MSMHNAYKAIDRVRENTEKTLYMVLEDLEELQEHIETLIELVKEDIKSQYK